MNVLQEDKRDALCLGEMPGLIPVCDQSSHDKHGGPKGQRENRGNFRLGWDDRASIQFFCPVVNNWAEDQGVHANQAQNDHLGPEEGIGSILLRLRCR